MMRRALNVAITGVLVVSSNASAQDAAAVTRVRGIAFDSVRGKPIADAFVAIVGSGWSTTSDARGRFQFDSVRPGSYAVTLQHETLDALGFPGLSTRVTITDGSEELRIAVPSFQTLWGRVCGQGRAPSDSGFIYGTVRHAVTNRPVGNAAITVVWYDSIARNTSGDDLAAKEEEAFRNTQKKLKAKSDIEPPIGRASPFAKTAPAFTRANWRVRGRSDESGTYAVCGVPVDGHGLRVHATADLAGSDSVDVHMETRVHRRDLHIGAAYAIGAASTGTVIGQVTDYAGTPVPFARIVTADVAESRSNENGHFIIRDVPAGTRVVEVRFIGMTPAHATIDVVAGDTATVALKVTRVPTLPGMTARATTLSRVLAAEFDARRKLGLGYLVDSTEISRYNSIVNVLREVPSLTIEHHGASLSASVPDGRGGKCAPAVWLDGLEAAYGNLFDLLTSEVVGLEVYVRPLTVPAAFMQKGGEQTCGAILVWTKYLFKNR